MSKIKSINPANNKLLKEVKSSTKAEIAQIVKKAKIEQPKWNSLELKKRVEIIEEFSNKLIENKEKIAKLVTKEIGMPITQSMADVNYAVEYLNWYLASASKYLSPEIVHKDKSSTCTVFHEPLGVAAVITAWNFPLSNFVWSVGQALIAGNTVVYKPPEECALFGKLLEDVVNNSSIPKGALTIVHGNGEVGDFLIHQEIDFISFTGSVKVGKHIYQEAGKKFIKAVCELGGSAPGIIFQDADLDSAIDVIFDNRFSNCGQICDGLKRLIVHEKVFDSVVEKLTNKLNSVKIGDPENAKTEIGPLVAKRQLKLLERQVNDATTKGAKIVVGGRKPKNLKGAFFEPTILINIKTGMSVWKEEVFGPVLPVMKFSSDDEAVKLANDTEYGLGAYIFTKNQRRASRIAAQVRTGMVSINGASYVHPSCPFGGYKNSGIGREHGKFGFHEVTQIKVVAN